MRAAVGTPVVAFTSFHTVFGGLLTSGERIKFFTQQDVIAIYLFFLPFFLDSNLAWDVSIQSCAVIRKEMLAKAAC